MKTKSQARSKQQVVSEFRRAEIISAARTVFARSGFTSAIMDAIAREAGIAKGTVYLYFRSKTEIYKAVLDHDMKALQASCLDRIHAAPTLPEKIEAFALARLENADARREFFRIMDAEGSNLTYSRRQYRDWHREPVLRLAQSIQEAARSGGIRPLPPEKTAWLISDMIRGAIQRRILEQETTPPADEARFLRDFIWPTLSADNSSAAPRRK
jgi:TetR/AcrR family transcriptional regulator of autoinduction and epiphytic fitness